MGGARADISGRRADGGEQGAVNPGSGERRVEDETTGREMGNLRGRLLTADFRPPPPPADAVKEA